MTLTMTQSGTLARGYYSVSRSRWVNFPPRFLTTNQRRLLIEVSVNCEDCSIEVANWINKRMAHMATEKRQADVCGSWTAAHPAQQMSSLDSNTQKGREPRLIDFDSDTESTLIRSIFGAQEFHCTTHGSGRFYRRRPYGSFRTNTSARWRSCCFCDYPSPSLSLAIQTRGNADDKSARLSNYFTQKAKDLMTDTRGRLVAYMRTCLHVVHTVAARGALQRNFPIFHSSEDDGKDRHSTSTPLSPPARRENR